MSEHDARSALMRMNRRVVGVAPHNCQIASDLHSLAMANGAEQDAALMARRDQLIMAYGLAPQEQRKPFAYSSGIAVIPVHGTLINRFGASYGFVTGYNFIRQQVAMAGQDPDVKGIVFDHNSYGGEVAGCFECASDIKRLAQGKPTMAVVDANCYSASYAMAVGADKIVATPSAGVGSIGVVAMHVSLEQALKEFGVKVTFIHAGAHKVDGNPYEDLSDEVKADIQKSVDASYEVFTTHVSEQRGLDLKKVKGTEARTYSAQEAKDLGLIDAVQPPNEAVQAFLAELSGSTFQPQQENTMSGATNTPGASTEGTPDTAKIAADAVKADRARTAGIKSLEEAKGREALADHFALHTDLSVEQVKAALAASPKTEAAAPNAFAAAMDATGNPNVGADNGGVAGAGGDGKSASARIIASARAAGVQGFEKAGVKAD